MSQELHPQLAHNQSSDTPIIGATQIALLASLGFHLLLYKYGFPNLLVQTKNISGPQTVSTIELNAFEQARLPDLDPEIIIPEFNNTPLNEATPPLALPNYINPDIGDLANLPPIPVPLLPDFANSPSYSTDIALPPIGDLSSLPLPPSIEDLDLESVPEVPLITPEEPEPLPEASEPPVAIKNPVKTEEKKPTPEQIAAVRQQKLEGNLNDISNSLTKDVGNTDEDARKNYVAWVSRIKEVQPKAVAFEGVYPKDACIRRLEGTSVYGVVVDTNNQIVSSELLKSADYPVFNQQAIRDIQKYDFGNQTAGTKPYRVTVDYKYNAEICPSLTLPSLTPENDVVAPQLETPQPETTETVTPPQPKKPEIVTPPKPEIPKPESSETVTPDNSFRERLRNTPLLDDDAIRERLRNTPLLDRKSPSLEEKPASDDSSTPNDSLRDRLQNTPLPDNDAFRERLRNAPALEN